MFTSTQPRPAVKGGRLPPGHLPVRQLRRAVRAAGQVNVSVAFDGRCHVLVRVPKRSLLEAIQRMKAKGQTVLAQDMFGALCVGG